MDKDKYNRSIKVNTRTYDFLIRFMKNRVKQDTDDRTLGFGQSIEVFYDFFLEDNESYKKVLKREHKKNV